MTVVELSIKSLSYLVKSKVHSHNTRFISKAVKGETQDISFTEGGRFSISKFRGLGKRYFACRGCFLWNDIPQHISFWLTYKFQTQGHDTSN